MNEKKYYYIREGQRQGPVTFDELKSFSISPDTLIWHNELEDWTRAKDLDELIGVITTPPEIEKHCTEEPPLPCTSIDNSHTSSSAHAKPPMPETHLTKAILITVLCCVPLGIVSLVYAMKVEIAYNNGKYDTAEEYSKKALRFCYIAVIAGTIGIIAYCIFMYVTVFSKGIY